MEVPFPETIDVGPWTTSNKSMIYKLTGVVEHQGSMIGGHYVAYLRDINGQWKYVSDASTSNCSAADLADVEAFLLFYTRVQPTEIDSISEMEVGEK